MVCIVQTEEWAATFLEFDDAMLPRKTRIFTSTYDVQRRSHSSKYEVSHPFKEEDPQGFPSRKFTFACL